MTKETKVKHSRTSSPLSYEKVFHELIDQYARKGKPGVKKQIISPLEFSGSSVRILEAVAVSDNDLTDVEDSYSDRYDETYSSEHNDAKGKEMPIECLENEVDVWDGI
ncbi:uncharacterized protein LOC133790961 [Humulus lupulus]|uniref:uncharacterized protein LOC133790961 n=1 Tax=Humulus lupulus TaxID=3486 RepID=UPI002B409C9E|nr:uncharacterized protein LOC133790961 [Humulus lupulus]